MDKSELDAQLRMAALRAAVEMPAANGPSSSTGPNIPDENRALVAARAYYVFLCGDKDELSAAHAKIEKMRTVVVMAQRYVDTFEFGKLNGLELSLSNALDEYKRLA